MDQEYQEVLQVATIKHSLNNALTTSVFNENEVESWLVEIKDLIAQIRNFETYTYDAVRDSFISRTSDLAYLKLISNLETIKLRYYEAIRSKQREIDNIVPALISQCNSIPRTGSLYSQYYLDMLSLVMQMQLSDFDGFTIGQKSQIISVSEQCSYFYPDPVFLARSLRSTFEPDKIEYQDDCEDNSLINLSINLNKEQFIIYPNPTDDFITTTLENTAEFEIISSIGRVIDVVKVDRYQKVDISSYSDGIYFLRIKQEFCLS